VNGLLYIVSKLSVSQPVINCAIVQPEDTVAPSEFKSKPQDKDVDVTSIQSIDSSFVKESDPNSSPPRVINSLSYEGRNNDPINSHAEYTCLWELEYLTRHFHPTVTHFATQILSQKLIADQPELHNHTLIHFLDRFAYRNAKKTSESGTHDISVMHPSLTSSDSLKFTNNSVSSNDIMDINFIKKPSSQVAADQLFFHKYFNLVYDSANAKNKRMPMNKNHEGDECEEDFFESLFGGPGKSTDEDLYLDDEIMEFSDDEMAPSIFEEGNLTCGEDALGFDDFSDNEDRDECNFASDAISTSEDCDIDEDDDLSGDSGIEFNLDSGTEPQFRQSKDRKSSLKRFHADFAEEFQPEKVLTANQRRNRDNKERRKKLKALPTFASIDDYSGMLSD